MLIGFYSLFLYEDFSKLCRILEGLTGLLTLKYEFFQLYKEYLRDYS